MAQNTDQQIAISAAPEGTFGQTVTLAAGYRPITTNPIPPVIPTPSKITNKGKSGTPWASQTRNDYWNQNSFPIGDDVSSGTLAIIIARIMGGTITSAPITAGQSYSHEVLMAPPATRTTPKSSSFATLLPGNDYLHGGCVIGSLEITQPEGGVPQWVAQIITSGKHVKNSTLGTPVVLAAPADEFYAVGAASVLVYTDGGGSLDVSQRVRNFRMLFNQNPRTGQRRWGDAFRIAGNRKSGAFYGRLPNGSPEFQFAFDVDLDSAGREYNAIRDNEALTGFAVTFGGDYIGTSTDYHQVQFVAAKAAYTNVTGGAVEDDSILSLVVDPLISGSDPGPVKAIIQNGTATLA